MVTPWQFLSCITLIFWPSRAECIFGNEMLDWFALSNCYFELTQGIIKKHIYIWQECILVGCKPSVSPSMHGAGGVSASGECLLLEGVPAARGMGVVPAPGGWYPSMHWGTPPIPLVDRILDTRYWKYYLAPNFLCGR